MTEQQVISLIQQYTNRGQFGVGSTQIHTHNGVDSQKLSQTNIVPGTRINSGTIAFAQPQTQYTLGITFNPTSVVFNGIAYNGAGTMKAICSGNALLGGSYYLAPKTSTSVTTAQQEQSITQSSTSFLVDNSGASPVFHVISNQTAIVDVTDGSTVFARLTVQGYNNSGLILYTTLLSSTWEIDGNFIIT